MIILDLYTFFAQFVPVPVLERGFIRSDGEEYDAFRKNILETESEVRMDGISDFIFGIDEESVIRRITSVKGIYLFVEYSRLSSTVNTRTDRKDDSLHLSVTVACPRPNDQDQISEAIWQDKALQIISDIRQAIREEIGNPLRDGQPLYITFPNSIQPFTSARLSHSEGWSMECDIQGVDIA